MKTECLSLRFHDSNKILKKQWIENDIFLNMQLILKAAAIFFHRHRIIQVLLHQNAQKSFHFTPSRRGGKSSAPTINCVSTLFEKGVGVFSLMCK
jgi:hypothetical protein